MASSKISKGLEANLPTTKVDGAMYFCTDTGNLYIDYQDGNSISRKIVNKNEMEELIKGAIDSMKKYTNDRAPYYAVCETPAATAIKTIPMPDGFELKAGAIVIVKFTNANTASSPKLKVGDTSAKPMYRYGTTKVSTGSTTTGWSAGSIQMFVYDGNGWVRDYWNNTTYSNASLGQGYGISENDSTTVKTVSLSSYSLTTGGIVSIKFKTNVDTEASLSINGKDAKPIYYNNSVISNGIIKAGDTATFIYYGNKYHLIAIDRWQSDIIGIQNILNEKMNKNNPVGTGSFSMNRKANTTIGDYSFTEGQNTTASGDYSHAEGYSTIAIGDSSHAEGIGNFWSITLTGAANATTYTLNNVSSYISVGRIIKYNNIYTKITSYDSNTKTINVSSTLSTSALNKANAQLILGCTYGEGSHSEGKYNVASGSYSHAEGYLTIASISQAHAEGKSTIASGLEAHAEGENTIASASRSHAEGFQTIANGDASHAEGRGTKASSKDQHVQGKYNIIDTQGSSYTDGKYAHIVGNGTSDTSRSNAHTLDWSGNAWFKGGLKLGGTSQDDTNAKEVALKATTLNGYGITDAYTKTETDTVIINAIDAIPKSDWEATHTGEAPATFKQFTVATSINKYSNLGNNKFTVTIGDEYVIHWKGKKYNCTVKVDDDNVLYLGNAVLGDMLFFNNGKPNTSEPFCFSGSIFSPSSIYMVYQEKIFFEAVDVLITHKDERVFSILPYDYLPDDIVRTSDMASQFIPGLMSINDKKKLDRIAAEANKYTLPNATSSTLGGVKIGNNISVSSGTISLTKNNVTTALGYTPPEQDTDNYHTPTIKATVSSDITLTGRPGSSNVKIATGTDDVSDLYIPVATASSPGATIVYPASSCTTYSSDEGTVTPAAVQKGAKLFSYPRLEKSAIVEQSIPRIVGDSTATISGVEYSKIESTGIKIETVKNSSNNKTANVIAIPAEGGKKMIYGYCTDQTDGTSFIGGLFNASATSYPYSAGLAIGGSSGNLLWKGAKVTTVNDTYAASKITAGTFAGQVVANSSGQSHNVSLLRNSKLVSTTTNPTVEGEICWTYE